MGYLELRNLSIHRLKTERDSLEYYKKLREDAKTNRDLELIYRFENKMDEHLSNINRLQTKINYMRENEAKDEENRLLIKNTYSKTIKESIPDYSPIVFYGIDNIGFVKTIIEHGFLIPAMSNDENKVFVTNKDNIRATLGSAEPSSQSYMPYGAIFAFKPLSEELKDIYQTTTSEFQVQNVNIKEEVDRLYGIITTDENIPRVQNWCLENGIPMEKVFTHDEFIKNIDKILGKKRTR